MPKPRLSLVGQRFGNLTVIADRGTNGHHSLWEVCCDCGNISVKLGTEIRSGKYCSHGCPYYRANLRGQRATHAMSRHPAYAVWRSMLARCTNPKHHAFKNYGGRGIGVCEEWLRFDAFWSDMSADYAAGLSLDRTDNDGGYCRDNCRWVSPKTQNRNKQGNVIIPTPFGRMTVAEASERFGIGSNTILYRIKNGWPADKLLLEPNYTNRIPQ